MKRLIKNEAYNECCDTTHSWLSQASDKSELVRVLLKEIADFGEENGVKVRYSVQD